MNLIKIRFARDHLGYICTPQNIERFMKHYDCIMEVGVVMDEQCQMYITGTAKPGKDLVRLFVLIILKFKTL